MRVSVIIPAIHEAERIGGAVRSAFAAGADEAIVVDGGSQDATIDRAREAGAIVWTSPPGRAIQQNVGARHATGEVLVFLHADNQLGPRALDQVRHFLSSDPDAGWGAMRQRIQDSQRVFRWIEWGNAWRVRWRSVAFGDQAIFVRRRWFDDLGGFAEVPLMEDLILSHALRRRCRPGLVPGPVLVDARRWNRRGPIRQTWLNWRLQWRFYRGADPAELAADYRRHDQ